MKVIKISTTILLGVVLLWHSSCKKTFFSNANNTPNYPVKVSPATLLTTVEGSLAYTQGGDMSRFASMFVQQTAGASRQCAAYYQYIFTNQDVDALWGNMYTSVLMNNDSLLIPADNRGYNEYSGVARVLKAYSLQITVDFWGKIPVSSSLQGVGNLHPSYDGDAAVYSNILTLCDEAIAKLSDTSAGLFVPGAEDIIYFGDATKWIKFAHAIKARVYMHQSANSAAMATSALNEIALSFTSSADNAVYTFDTKETFANPWYQFNEQRDDISFISGTMIGTMDGMNDPRTYLLVDTTNPDFPDNLGAYYGNINSVVEFITYDELQFMKAEATIRSGGTVAAAQTAYQNGITESMAKLGVDGTDMAAYLTTNGSLTTANAISKIAYEEYIALYLNPEAWTLWRRTGFPVLTPTKGSAIPRRLLYPQTEISYNKANTPDATLFIPKIFWDN